MFTTDSNKIINYVNTSAKTLFSDNAEVIRKLIPSFDADALVGQSLNAIFNRPEAQQKLSDNGATLDSELDMGDLLIGITVKPLAESAGYLVEMTDRSELRVGQEKLKALGKTQATIEFDMDGIILAANENFLVTLGYSLEEIIGRHHSLFVTSDYKESVDYKQFWEKLNRGEYESAEYKRIGKGGKEVWIQASYNPILDVKWKTLLRL